MVANESIESIYRQNLECDIIRHLAKMKGINLRQAFDIYYSSRLAQQIMNGENGIENMDPKYLAEDLIENEGELFQASFY